MGLVSVRRVDVSNALIVGVPNQMAEALLSELSLDLAPICSGPETEPADLQATAPKRHQVRRRRSLLAEDRQDSRGRGSNSRT